MEINITRHFGQLFTLQILHNYYEDKRCGDFVIEPTYDTAKWMQKRGLLFKSYAAEIGIGFRNETIFKAMLAENEEVLQFSFVLKEKTPYFLNYTELPFKQKGQCFHFSNLQGQEVEGKQILHPEEFANADNLIPYFPPVFRYKIAEPKEKVNLVVKNEEGKEVWEEEVELHGQQAVIINLSEEPSGRYQVIEDGEEKLSCYVGKTRQSVPFGFVDIFLHPDQVLGEERRVPHFTLNFQTRAVRWKYYLVGLSEEMRYKDFKIEDERKDLEFEGETEGPTLNNKPSKSIISKELISFSENPKGPLELSFQRIAGKKNRLKKKIPNPSYEHLVQGTDKDTYFAEIFINI